MANEIYNPHRERQEALKDARFSLGSSAAAAIRGAVPFARQIMQPETYSLNFEREDINWEDEDIQEAMKGVPSNYRGDLLKARNKDSLMADIAGIKSGLEDLQYMDEQHGFIPSMGLYMAASVVDPISWTGYGLAARLASAGKFAASLKQASTMKKAGYWGGSSAGIEGVSEAIIQYGGEKDYGSVPIAAAFGFGLAGTGSMAHSLLSTSVSARKADAVAKLSDESYTLKSSVDEAQQLVNTINLSDEARPFRSTLSTIVDRLTGSKSPILRSPTYRAFMKGGKASSFARLIDTPAGVSKNEAGEIIPHAERTVMDEKYDIARDFLEMEITRIKAKEKSGLDEDAFTELVWKETQINRQRYEETINNHKAEIRNNKELIKELRENLQAEIEADEVALATRKKELKEQGLDDDAISKKIEEETKARVDRNLDREIQKRAIEEETANPVKTEASSEGIAEMIEASSNYYGKMHKRMMDAGVDEADSMLPKYYTPIMYDTKSIKLGDDTEVMSAFEEAIQSSASYRAMVNEARLKVEEARSKGNLSEELEKQRDILVVKQGMLERIEQLMKYDIHEADKLAAVASKIDDIDDAYVDYISSIFNKMRESGLEPRDVGKSMDDSMLISGGTNKEFDDMVDIAMDNKNIKELMELTGLSKDDIFESLNNSISLTARRKIGISMENVDDLYEVLEISPQEHMERIIAHEMVHAVTERAYVSNPAFKKKADEIKNDIIANKDKIIDDIYKNNNVEKAQALEARINYAIEVPSELHSVILAEKDIAIVMNKIKVKTDKTSISLFKKLLNNIKTAFGIKRLNKDSVLYKTMQSLESIPESKFDKGTKARARKAMDTKSKIDRERLAEIEGERVDNSKRKELEKQLKKEMNNITKVAKANVTRVQNKIKDIKKEITETTDNMKASQKELHRVLQYPKKAAKATVESIRGAKKITDMDLANANPVRLKGRKLPIDVSHPAMEPYVVKNEAALAQMYNYTMGGRVASKKILGFDKPEEMRRHLMDEQGMHGEDLEMSMESFELALGTRQIPADSSDAWEKSIRMISHFNYITMGGQFAKTGMSEIGAGVYRTGFRYLGELFPALKDVIASYRGKDLSTVGNDSMSMVDASAIYQNKSHSAFSDTDYIESTFAQGLERGLKKASTKFFKYSGLEGVTTMTQIALPRAFLRRIINEANNPSAQLDMIRWGLDIDDMKAIAKQPFVKDKNGIITDFNFEKWDKGLADKFQVVAQRMSRDAVMRPDAVRIPTWVNDGGTSPIFKLAKQFTTFTFLSNERLMLAGMNENRAMALTGMVISGAVLYAAEKAAEEISIATGIIDEEDARFRDEEGEARLASYIATRHSFAGGLGVVAETINAMGTSYGDRQLATRFLGGVTASRGLQATDAAGDLMNGKYGTAGQIYFLKSMIPFNNMLGLDTFNKNVAKGLVEDARRNNYYQSE